jgi:phosphate:Na+ symporter
MIFFQIGGGIALTVFGVRFLRKGFERLFGGRMVAWLSGLTERRWKAFGAGMVVGTLAPSSTAISLVTMQMMNAGQLTAERMFALLLGANVGITVTVQMMAFHLQEYAGAFILVGVVGFQFLKREILRGTGQCLLALGLIFLGMQLIGTGAGMVSGLPEMNDWVRLFNGHPLLTFLLVALFTVSVQSSTASIGFALGLSATGLFGAQLLVPWVLGANMGIGLTALAAGWPMLEGRRLATANLLAKGVLALPLLIFTSLPVELFDWIPGSTMRDTAIFHTGFNFAVGLLFVPLAGPLTRLMRWMIAPAPVTVGLPTIDSHLDLSALESPSIALANAAMETMKMIDSVKRMLEFFWKGYETGNPVLVAQVRGEDDRVDRYYRDIKDYLSRIREGLTPEESQWQFAMMTFSNELESVGDIIDKNLCDMFHKQRSEAVQLSAEDHEALEHLQSRVLARIVVAQGLLANRGGIGTKEFLDGKEVLNRWCREAERHHYERLRAAQPGAIASSAYFLDLMDSFRRINSHITTIGYSYRTSPSRKRTTRTANSGETRETAT